ncbi:MAG: type 1 glutamine amidotransferase [Gaiellales bacterium]
MDILVLQHIACEPPAEYGTVLASRGHTLHTVEVDEGEALPDWREFGAIVAMGGPMGAYEDDAYPWLADEKRLIGDAVRAGLPYFGACLGVQLLAASLGARVYPGGTPEIGILDVMRTEDGGSDPVASILPERFKTLQWHSDTFDLPEGAVSLFSSPAYPNQGFRFGEVAYGVQFHLEVDAALADAWSRVPAYKTAAEDVLGPGGLDTLLSGVHDHADRMLPHARTLIDAWLDHVLEYGRS